MPEQIQRLLLEEYQYRASQYFRHAFFRQLEVIFPKREKHGDPHDEHKERKYQIGGSEAVPTCML